MISRLLKNPLVHLFYTTWGIAEGRRLKMVLYLAMSSVAMMVALCFPLIIASLMNSFQTKSGEELLSDLVMYLSLMVLSDVVFWALHGPSRYIETQLGFQLRGIYQRNLFRMVTNLPMRWHRDHHSGETIDQVSRATSALGEFSGRTFEVVHTLSKYFGALAILFWFMPWAGLIVAIATLGVVTSVLLFDRVLIRQYEILNKNANAVAAAVQDYLTNVGTVISLRLEERVGREVMNRFYRVLPVVKRNSAVNELKWFTASIMITVTQSIVLIAYCVITIRSGEPLLAGTFFALYEYLRSIAEAFFSFTWKYSDLIMQSAKVRGVEHIGASFASEILATQSAKLPSGWHRIDISELSFSHGDAAENGKSVAQIRDIGITLQRGKSYAFVGESGSGKSTALGLIRGIHTADRSKVVVDGHLMPFGLVHVSHATTLIPQDPEIFSETIRFNITMGLEVQDSAIFHAAKLARFAHVLERLPKGLDTSIAEKGVSLSGGEKQRLALARGLFFVEESGSEIVLLDEPTSSVDLLNERIIYEQLLAGNKHRCVVSAIHKFHLLHLFDEIVVFGEGRVLESGSLEELLSSGGEFCRLHSSMAQSSAA